jgi:hypothetical protein
VGKPAGKRPLEKHEYRWKDNSIVDRNGRVERRVLDLSGCG